MENVILFSFYKEPQSCLQRLTFIRRLNPGVPIYGLYGGSTGDIRSFEKVIDLLDDYWAHPSQDPYWKWQNTDIMLMDWFNQRGHKLPWLWAFFYQWDFLQLEPLHQLLNHNRSQDEFLWGLNLGNLEELKSVDWCWVKEDNPEFEQFKIKLFKEFGKKQQIWGGALGRVDNQRLRQRLT